MLFPLSSNAEELVSGAFVVQPAKVELSLDPGGKATKQIRVFNGTSTPLEVTVSFVDSAPKQVVTSHEQPIDPIDSSSKEETAYSVQKYISLPTKSLQLLSGKQAEIPVEVSIPSTLSPGGRYGMLLVNASPVTSLLNKGQVVSLDSQIAVSFYVRINGAVVEQGGTVAFDTFDAARFYQQPSATHPLFFSLTYKNDGTVHLNPYGEITIRPIWGDVKHLAVDPWVVLPQSTRSRELAVSEEIPLGFYRATLEMNRGYQDIVDTESTWFVVLPRGSGWIWMILVIVVIVYLIRRSLRLSRYSLS
jgi:hypothetical protein